MLGINDGPLPKNDETSTSFSTSNRKPTVYAGGIMHKMCGSRSRQWRPYSLWAECAGLSTNFKWVKKWKECDRRWVKGEEKGEIKVDGEPHTSWAHVDGMTSEHKTHDLSHAVHVQCMTMCWHKMNETRHVHPGFRVDVLCVEDSHGGHVVIGVGRGIVQRHHASITYQDWNLTFSPFLYMLSDCMLWSSLLSCSHLLHTFAPRKRVEWGVVFTPPVGYSGPASAVNDQSVTK